MPKITLDPKRVQNLGGYINERKANLPYRDVVVGNPLDHPVKVEVPVYAESYFDDMRAEGILVEPIYAGDSLKEALDKMKQKIGVKVE